VGLRDLFPDLEAGGIGGTLGDALRIDDNTDVIVWVNADKEPGHTGILALC
jgi:hypothetical protein